MIKKDLLEYVNKLETAIVRVICNKYDYDANDTPQKEWRNEKHEIDKLLMKALASPL